MKINTIKVVFFLNIQTLVRKDYEEHYEKLRKCRLHYDCTGSCLSQEQLNCTNESLHIVTNTRFIYNTNQMHFSTFLLVNKMHTAIKQPA